MDFDKKRYRPVSTGVLLIQQVKEQSVVCNFTVKQGLWSKRYHDCVVRDSPFVEAMMRNNFDEKAKGFVEMKLGSPESIDMVIMFLYGQFPKLTIDNVSAMMHLAEFLLIPKLKAFCIDWINNKTKLDEESVEKLLHLSSIFDFEVPTLTKYIRQHLPELFGGNHLLTITADTLENMFSDATLSYVNADVRFEFMMRWVEHSPEQRKQKLDEIIARIELQEVTASVMEKAKGNKHLENLHSLFESVIATAKINQNVWITYQPIDDDFWVFDYGRNRWYRLKGIPHCQFTEMFTFAPGESIVCLVQTTFDKWVIHLYDFSILKELSCTSLSFIISRKTSAFERIYIADKVCYVVSRDQVTTENKTVIGQRKLELRLHQMTLSRGPITNFKIMDKKGTHTMRRSTLWLGTISKCSEETVLTPLLSLNVSFEVKLVVNEAKLVALYSRTPKLFCIYDTQSCKLENIDINLDCNDKVSPFKDGFAIFGEIKTRLIVPGTISRVKRPVVVCGAFRKERKVGCTFRVVANKWLRFKYGDHSIDSKQLDYTMDELDKVNVKHVEWKHIPLPYVSVDESIICNIQEISIPRVHLKCNLRCPHCTRIKGENTIRYLERNSLYDLVRESLDLDLYADGNSGYFYDRDMDYNHSYDY